MNLNTYTRLPIDQRTDAFFDFMVAQGKAVSTARGYVRWSNSDIVKDYVLKNTGKTSLYEVTDLDELRDIKREVNYDRYNKKEHGSPSATLGQYIKFINQISSSSISSRVQRPSTIISNSSFNFRSANHFINSTIPSVQELDLMELIVNFMYPLINGRVCFADIIDSLEVEFNPDKKVKTERVSLNDLTRLLPSLRKTKSDLKDKIHAAYNSEGRGDTNRLPVIFDHVCTLISRIEHGQCTNSIDIKVDTLVLGEFVPAPNPKVVLYYNNMGNPQSRRETLIGVFVHEMFHAWNYFQSGSNGRSVLAVDEPMVEFAGLVFLRELYELMDKSNHALTSSIEAVLWDRKYRVMSKQTQIGDVAAYGFGSYLYENVGYKERDWIEAYSQVSSSINPNDKDVITIKDLLVPCYPFQNEDKVKKLFERVIFNRKSLNVRSTAIGSSQIYNANGAIDAKELLRACLELLPISTFTLKDAYRFDYIFKVVYGASFDSKAEIKIQLNNLINEGFLTFISPNLYVIN